jgi:hypothetical protein
MLRLGLQASERLVNVDRFQTVAVSGVFSGDLLIRSQIRRPAGTHDLEGLAAIPRVRSGHSADI